MALRTGDPLVSEMQELRREVAELRSDIASLLEAWNTARGLVKFVKWLSSMAVAITSIWALFKLSGGK